MNSNKIKIAKYLLIANAVLVSVGYGALAGLTAITYAPGTGPHLKEAMGAFSIVFFPLSIFWSLFCYGAYKNIKGNNKITFWLFVICNVIMVVFPVGTMFAVALIYLRRSIKNEETTKPA
jgi:uncharacterized membrane protein YhdT